MKTWMRAMCVVTVLAFGVSANAGMVLLSPADFGGGAVVDNPVIDVQPGEAFSLFIYQTGDTNVGTTWAVDVLTDNAGTAEIVGSEMFSNFRIGILNPYLPGGPGFFAQPGSETGRWGFDTGLERRENEAGEPIDENGNVIEVDVNGDPVDENQKFVFDPILDENGDPAGPGPSTVNGTLVSGGVLNISATSLGSNELKKGSGIVTTNTGSGEFAPLDEGFDMDAGLFLVARIDLVAGAPGTATLSTQEGSTGMVSGIIGVDIDYGTATINVVPEPATMLLLGLGGLAAIRRRK